MHFEKKVQVGACNKAQIPANRELSAMVTVLYLFCCISFEIHAACVDCAVVEAGKPQLQNLLTYYTYVLFPNNCSSQSQVKVQYSFCNCHVTYTPWRSTLSAVYVSTYWSLFITAFSFILLKVATCLICFYVAALLCCHRSLIRTQSANFALQLNWNNIFLCHFLKIARAQCSFHILTSLR